MYISKEVKQLTTTLIANANQLANQHEQYVGEFVTRGRQELYKILTGMYSTYIAIEQCGNVELVVQNMRKTLREVHEIKTSSKASTLAIVIRYITRASNKTVSVYKRVLDSAYSNGIKAEDLSIHITKHGGIDKCGKAIVDAEDAKKNRESENAVLRAITKDFESRPALATLSFANGKVPALPGSADVNFIHLLCKHSRSTGMLEVVTYSYPSSTLESEAFQVHIACCTAASMDDGKSGDFRKYCHEHGLDMDNVHRWMIVNGISDFKAAKNELSRLKSLTTQLLKN